jgi:hypothetical protein
LALARRVSRGNGFSSRWLSLNIGSCSAERMLTAEEKLDDLQEFHCTLYAHELSLSSASNPTSTFLERQMAKKAKAKAKTK